MPSLNPDDVLHFSSPPEFRQWLEEHHRSRHELWVGYWKKGTGRESVTWPETVDEALCFGWIDGIRRRLSDEAYTIRFTPRRPGSTWSRRNLERYRELQSRGRISLAGKEAFDRRIEEKTDVYSYEDSKHARLPGEFLRRIEAVRPAWSEWQGRPPSYRKKVVQWVMSAKKEETRERRLTKLIDDLSSGRA
jgi:uncharacterized protein YdeI (YjbR/CyaY-like superfamily)